jgi:hypothetical protein
MTASPGREVDANLLRSAAPGSAQTRADAQDPGGQDLGDLVEALGRGHEVGVQHVVRFAGCGELREDTRPMFTGVSLRKNAGFPAKVGQGACRSHWPAWASERGNQIDGLGR